jgi:hypothetical protein
MNKGTFLSDERRGHFYPPLTQEPVTRLTAAGPLAYS